MGQYQDFNYTRNLNIEIEESAGGKGREIKELMSKLLKNLLKNKNLQKSNILNKPQVGTS